LESPAAGIIGHKRESEGIMRVLGPTEVTGLLRRTLYRLPSEKIICLDEIQTVISKLDGGEFRDAVRNSLSPFSKNTYPVRILIMRWSCGESIGLWGLIIASPGLLCSYFQSSRSVFCTWEFARGWLFGLTMLLG
jgi:hypothetical protein